MVAGSFQGHTGHVDGKPSDARFKDPKGVTMDDKGNIYVADTANLAIRKIGEAGAYLFMTSRLHFDFLWHIFITFFINFRWVTFMCQEIN